MKTIIVAGLLIATSLTTGCKSDETKCREAGREFYQKKLAACQDDACRKSIEANMDALVEKFVSECR